MGRMQDELLEMAQDMYDCGMIDKARMLEYEALHRESLAEEAAELAAAESAERSSGKPGLLQAAQA